MLYEIQPWPRLVLAQLLVFNLVLPFRVRGDPPEVPCFFIFGDSLVDNGNNNDLSTLAKSNYAPYGIDYPGGPTGRFTNGRTTVDFLADLLGFAHHIPSYLTSNKSNNNSNLLEGVNYASGSAGIRNETGYHLGARVSFSQQIDNHKSIFSRIALNVFNSTEKAVQHLNKCLYYVGIGNNDYINNFFIPEKYSSSKIYTVDEFTDSLIRLYEEQIRSLYEKYGARKFILVGTGLIGCTPRAIGSNTSHGPTGCVDSMNRASEDFNQKLFALVDQLNRGLTNGRFIYINGMEYGDPSSFGFKNAREGCCVVRKDGQCRANENPCENRTEYVFWDSFHPTEGINKLTATSMYKAAPSNSYPFDISQLAALNLN